MRVRPNRWLLVISHRAILFPLAIQLMLGCAEVGPPPGGEVDRTGPHLIESQPADGALNVSPDRKIELFFSETLVKPEKGRGVFVSPRPAVEPKIRWKSNRIQIELARDFLPDQTYLITVSSDVTDLRRNHLDSAVVVAFSTGDHIDSGTVAGQVLTPEGEPVVGWPVGLYRQTDPAELIGQDSVYPAYLLTTGGDGRFRFRYLPTDDYLMVAFEDQNRDELLTPEAESFALPDRPVNLTADLALDCLIMTTTKHDPLRPQLISAVSTVDALVRVRLNKPIDPSWLAHDPGRFRLMSETNDARLYEAQGVLESGQDETAVLTASFGTIPEGSYRISFDSSAALPSLAYDSLQIRKAEDESAPQVVGFQPTDQPLFVNQVEIVLTFSEPIDTSRLTDQTFVLWEDTTAIIPVSPEWLDCFRLSLTPDQLESGFRYRLDLTEFDLIDRAGNALGDSLRSYSFSTVHSDSLGSIGGQVGVNLPDRQQVPSVLTFRQVGTQRDRSVTVAADGGRPVSAGETVESARSFRVDVLPGKYLLSGFLDSNGDGKLTPGSLQPYRAGETRAFLTDTVTVRARFETAGVRFSFD